MKLDPDGPVDLWPTLIFLIKWGFIIWLCAFLFLACTDQLPSDPG